MEDGKLESIINWSNLALTGIFGAVDSILISQFYNDFSGGNIASGIFDISTALLFGTWCYLTGKETYENSLTPEQKLLKKAPYIFPRDN